MGTPLFITHTSRDGQWYFIECPVAAGWVDASDVALVDDDFIRRYKTGSYAAIVRDKVMLPGSQCGQVNIGTVLPLADTPAGQPGHDQPARARQKGPLRRHRHHYPCPSPTPCANPCPSPPTPWPRSATS